MRRSQRLVWGSAVDVVGKLVAPPLLGVGAAYGTDAQLRCVEYASIGLAGIVPAGLLAIGSWIRSGGRRDESLKIGLEVLVKNLLSPPDSSDPLSPSLRATVFVPEKQKTGDERLVPRFRLSSAVGAVIQQHGEPDFRSSVSFGRGDAFAGQTWESGREVVRTIQAISDFPGDDGARLKAWKEQWERQGVGRPDALSPYMRGVRSLWTFAIPESKSATEVKSLAVFSVDSTCPDAFRVLDEEEPPASASKGLMMRKIHLREAIAAIVAGIVLTGMGGHRQDGFFHHVFRKK